MMRNAPVSGLSVPVVHFAFIRWFALLALAMFTVVANFMANAFWQASGHDRAMLMNGFFEYIGLAGVFIYAAWDDLKERA
ncbi:hypothetical protein [Rahnella selenatireducens]|uniref:hypothetical protein n=1 Tax=Rahnella selenatireducens TaxID=3389797 RepID=UPI00396833AC